jgi:PAS domain S-box-containing protein
MTDPALSRGTVTLLLPIATAVFAIGIFIADTTTELGIAIPVLYVVVVVMAARFCRARGLVLVAAGCVGLTVLSYFLTPHGPVPAAVTNTLISIATTVLTTLLLLQTQAVEGERREQANLLDLTHDAIFVRDMESVIKYWNRGAQELYGWAAEQAAGKGTHDLLKTVFPASLDQIGAEVLHTGRWEGELVHTKKDGTQVMVASRWSLQRDKRGAPIAVLETNNDITERKQAEEALRQSEEQWRDVFENNPTMYFVVNPAGMVLSVNPFGAEQLGYSVNELAGDSVLKVFYEPDREAAKERVALCLKQPGRSMSWELRKVRKNGTMLWVRETARAVHRANGPIVLVACEDITERKRAEQRLVAQHRIAQVLGESTGLNEAAPKILEAICEGLDWDVGALWRVDKEASLLRCVEVWHKQSVSVPEFESATRQITFSPGIGLPGKVWLSSEPRYIPDLGREANFQRTPIAARERLHAAFGFPILLSGEVLGVIEFFSREIRQPDQELLEMMSTSGSHIGQFIERKRAEEALLGAQAELTHVTRVATLGEMTASIAHEINQPLGAIVNNASACVRWLAARNVEEARRSAALVIDDGHRAAEIIQRIRSFAKKTPPQKDWIDINQTIREVIALMRSDVQRNNVALEARLSDDVHHEPLIFADRIQLQQVILNLIINAVEAMKEVSDGRRELLIRSGTDPSGGIVVAVRDSGPGLAAENLDRLFTPFYTTKPQGMGMGLAICRSIIEAHGGQLWATANDDRGATFQFTLPSEGERTA